MEFSASYRQQVSASAHCAGYSKLVGQFLSSASSWIGSTYGFHILQSSDYGEH